MSRKLKKFVMFIISFTLLLSTQASLFALQPDRDTKIQELVKKGIPKQYLQDGISDTTLNELSKDEGQFISVTKTTYKIDKTTNQLQVSAMGLLGDMDFTNTTFVQRIYEKSGDNFKFTVNGHWNKRSFWTLTDTAALAWSDGFALYYDSCTYENCQPNGVWYTASYPRNSMNPAAGVAHAVDIIAGKWISGTYTQVAKVNNSVGSNAGSANVMAQYAHVGYGLGAPTATFAGTMSGCTIQFSIQSTVDFSQPAYSYFDY